VRRRYLIVMPRPMPATALVVRRRYMAGVPRLMPGRLSLCVAGT
jgi:hypothetical protein